MSHSADTLIDAVKTARSQQQPIHLTGANTKAFLRRNQAPSEQAMSLSLGDYSGIIDYQPSELVISAKAGTPLTDIEHALAQHQQRLSFEPPNFDQQSTLGGAVASGLSGPATPWQGSLRDHVLGAQLINGLGESLKFGGAVIKNVAGYDVSRLNCGAFGRLGMVLSVSLRVQPVAAYEQSYCVPHTLEQANALFRRTRQTATPVSAAMHLNGQSFVRLSGAQRYVQDFARTLKGASQCDNDLWREINQLTHPFFASSSSGKARLWRINLPAEVPCPLEESDQLIDWAGQQRWLWSDLPEQALRQQLPPSASAWVIHGEADEIAPPRSAIEQSLTRSICQAFDPDQLFAGNHP